MLLGFVFVVMGITIVQERRTERALDALRDLSSPRALVIRDGRQRRIAGREVVRGDIIVLAEGDRVPADAVLRCAINLVGRRVAADRRIGPGAQGRLRGRARRSTGPAATICRSSSPARWSPAGQGVAEVLATGPRTELGKIGKALQTRRAGERRLLQKETGRLVRNLAVVGLSLCALVVVDLRPDAGQHGAGLERGAPGRHRHGHGHAAGGVPGRAHDLPGPRRLADLAAAAC